MPNNLKKQKNASIPTTNKAYKLCRVAPPGFATFCLRKTFGKTSYRLGRWIVLISLTSSCKVIRHRDEPESLYLEGVAKPPVPSVACA